MSDFPKGLVAFTFLVFFSHVGFCGPVSEVCLNWFSKHKIVAGIKCQWECAAAPVGMGTFDCGSECENLCELAATGGLESQGIYTPYLTIEEGKFAAKHPKDALKAYKLKELAEKMTLEEFGRSDFDDESDAFRHYVWAGLLSKELGTEVAKNILDAHESGGEVNAPSRLMDLSNNRAGLISAEILKTKKQLSEKEIRSAALQELKRGKLIVLRKRGGPR